MPKKTHILIPLPKPAPDSCVQCPFLGYQPAAVQASREKGTKKTMWCIACRESLTKEGARKKLSEHHDIKHKFHRPCEEKWVAWWRIQGGKFPMRVEAYNECRLPYEQDLYVQETLNDLLKP